MSRYEEDDFVTLALTANLHEVAELLQINNLSIKFKRNDCMVIMDSVPIMVKMKSGIIMAKDGVGYVTIKKSFYKDTIEDIAIRLKNVIRPTEWTNYERYRDYDEDDSVYHNKQNVKNMSRNYRKK